MHGIRCTLLCPLVAASMAVADAPVQIATRVELRKGSILIGLRNTTPEPLGVSVRVLGADGVVLPVASFGAHLPARATWWRYLPVRDVTRDEPVLDCVLVYGGTNVLRQRVTGRSGALFRDATAAYASTGMPRRAPVFARATAGGARELRVRAAPVLTDLAAAFGATTVLPWSVSNASLHAQLVLVSSVVATATLAQRANGRGDFALTLLSEVHAPGLQSNDVPALTALLPATFLSNTVIAARRDGTYVFTPAETLADPAIAAQFSGPAVDEWSVITVHDWLIVSLDAAQLAMQHTHDGLRVRITSRAPWLPPFIPGRAHAIQLRLHMPVGLLP